MRTTICARVAGSRTLCVELGLGADVLLAQLLAIVVIQQGATVEGIHDQEGLAGMRRPSEVRRNAKQEVSGEVDALRLQAGAPCHLQVNDRERDGDARAPVQHLVEKAVARIVVVLAVPAEPHLVVEVLVQDPHGILRGVDGVDARRGLCTHLLDRPKVGLGVERRILDSRDRQNGRREVATRPGHRAAQITGHPGGPRTEVQGQRHGWMRFRTVEETLSTSG